MLLQKQYVCIRLEGVGEGLFASPNVDCEDLRFPFASQGRPLLLVDQRRGSAGTGLRPSFTLNCLCVLKPLVGLWPALAPMLLC